jgi:hypothetical protein
MTSDGLWWSFGFDDGDAILERIFGVQIRGTYRVGRGGKNKSI